MSRLLFITWFSAVSISVGAIGIAARDCTRARSKATTELARLSTVTPQVREIAALRSAAPSWSARAKPGTALAPTAAAAIASSGLPPSALSNVSPEAQTTVGDGQFKAVRQRATITLTSVTLPDIGRFLDAWRLAEPDWTIAGVDLSPVGDTRRMTPTPGSDLPLRAVIIVESMTMQSPSNRFLPGGNP
jgi:hypothetical protein